jgi:hypothetical protein
MRALPTSNGVNAQATGCFRVDAKTGKPQIAAFSVVFQPEGFDAEFATNLAKDFGITEVSPGSRPPTLVGLLQPATSFGLLQFAFKPGRPCENSPNSG